MSVFENIHPENPQRQVDLLVDGELSEADRRALLLQLEHEPDGWRRCALAFLEAQSWKAELGQVAPGPALDSARPEAVSQAEPNGRWQSWRQYAATTLAMAASFLLALVVVRGWSGGPHSPESSLVNQAKDEFRLPSPVAVPGEHAVPAAGTTDNLETVTLTAPKSSDGPAETLQVQAQRRDAFDQGLLDHIPAAIPPEVQQAIEQAGHRIVQQREIVPVQMNDGRRLVVPVDHIQIHYVGRPLL